MSSVPTEKEKIRRSMLNRRNTISSTEVLEKSRLIQHNVINCRHFMISATLGVYLPIGTEVRTEEIIQRALETAKKVALPRIESDKIRFYQLNNSIFQKNSLVVGKFGLKEPRKQGTEIKEMDLLIVPGIAFDNEGSRIGYGRGYFDRYMMDAKVSFSLGLGYRFQLVTNRLPQSHLDKRVNGLSTETGIVYF
jgi:5-formyltetrahydrofolate cyclo-ligase